MNLNDLQTFALVAKHGTLTEAATVLDVPKSTVSRRITRLEDALGVALFSRASRRIVLTQDGRAFYERIDGLLEGIQEAGRILQEQGVEPEGVLRITTTEGYGQSPAVLECIASYLQRYPKVTVDLVLTSRVTDLVEDQIDVGFRLYTGDLPGDANTMSRRLHTVTSGLYVSPNYLAQNDVIESLDDLSHHTYVGFGRVDFTQKPWLLHNEEMETPPIFPTPSMVVNNTAALTHCALVGMGICILDDVNAAKFVEQGMLVRVLPMLSQQIAKVSLVWVATRHLSVKTRSFLNHAIDCLKSP